MAPLTAAAAEGIEMLKAGSQVTKYGRAGAAHATTFRLSRDETALTWERIGMGRLRRKSVPRIILVTDILELLIGQARIRRVCVWCVGGWVGRGDA